MDGIDVISLGGGWQSSTLHLMADEGLITPRPVMSVFADTGWEPKTVYEHLDWLESVSSIPIARVSNGRNLRDDTSEWVNDMGVPKAQSLPLYILNPDGTTGMMRHRQCTDKYKIRPIERFVREKLLGLPPRTRVPKTMHVTQWIGFSYDERMRMKPSRQKWVTKRFPLIEMQMTRQDCRAWFNSRFPDRVLPRSACSGCPFRSDAEWLDLKQTAPDDFQDAIKVDEALRANREARGFMGYPFLHRRVKPIAEAVEEYERHLEINPQLPGLDSGSLNECDGVCMV